MMTPDESPLEEIALTREAEAEAAAKTGTITTLASSASFSSRRLRRSRRSGGHGSGAIAGAGGEANPTTTGASPVATAAIEMEEDNGNASEPATDKWRSVQLVGNRIPAVIAENSSEPEISVPLTVPSSVSPMYADPPGYRASSMVQTSQFDGMDRQYDDVPRAKNGFISEKEAVDMWGQISRDLQSITAATRSHEPEKIIGSVEEETMSSLVAEQADVEAHLQSETVSLAATDGQVSHESADAIMNIETKSLSQETASSQPSAGHNVGTESDPKALSWSITHSQASDQSFGDLHSNHLSNNSRTTSSLDRGIVDNSLSQVSSHSYTEGDYNQLSTGIMESHYDVSAEPTTEPANSSTAHTRVSYHSQHSSSKRYQQDLYIDSSTASTSGGGLEDRRIVTVEEGLPDYPDGLVPIPSQGESRRSGKLGESFRAGLVKVKNGSQKVLSFSSTNTQDRERMRRKDVMCTVCMIVSLLVLVLIIFFAVNTRKSTSVIDDITNTDPVSNSSMVPSIAPEPSLRPSNQPTTLSPTAYPSAAPMTLAPFDSNELAMFNFLKDLALQAGATREEDVVLEEGTLTPQVRAIRWLASQPDTLYLSHRRMLQRFALATIYYSTNGGGWGLSTGWLSDLHECEWFSRSPHACSDDGWIVRLSLGMNDLSGTIPPEIGLLRNVEVISLTEGGDSNLRSARLFGTLPTTMQKLNKLQYLNLRGQSISGTLSDEVVQSWSALSLIDLTNNKFEGPLPSSLGSLPDLRSVHVNSNHFNGTLPESIGFSLVNVLALGRNRFSGAFPASTQGMMNLRELRMEHNQFTSLPEGFKAINLRQFVANDNKLEGPLPAFAESPRFLESIILYNNRFEGRIPEAWGSLENLSEVDVSSNRLTGTVPENLTTEISSLVGLRVQDNSLSGSITCRESGLLLLGSEWVADCRLAAVGDDNNNATSTPEIECPCCTSCCIDGEQCQAQE